MNCLQDAEDITQQVCLKLAKVIKQFRFESSFTSWLYRIVVNTTHDWNRKNRRQTHSEDEPETTDSIAEQDAELERVLAEIDSLGKGFKETALLVYGEGLTHSEAAEVLGVKESTISWRLHRIRQYFTEQEPASTEVTSHE